MTESSDKPKLLGGILRATHSVNAQQATPIKKVQLTGLALPNRPKKELLEAHLAELHRLMRK